jgi:hypothetical protein
MVLNVIFNNISVISWWSVLLVEETTDLPQITDKLFELRTLVVIDIDCAWFQLAQWQWFQRSRLKY